MLAYFVEAIFQINILQLSSSLLKREKLEPYLPPNDLNNHFMSSKDVVRAVEKFPALLHEENIAKPEKRKMRRTSQRMARPRAETVSGYSDNNRARSASRKEFVEKPRKRES